ncbi:MAG TPA: hypothetical protein VFY84_19195 [Jiangellales bacterium]|nr:hypothetical protein [Jiangellales bacterium]
MDTRTQADLLWEDVAYYGWYAEVYQWTPDQVDALPGWYADRVRSFHDLAVTVAEEKSSAGGNGGGPSTSPYVKGPVTRMKRY